ncbi:hypothetical protein FACS1894125_5080 [Actinomycetota bacterium]|nr:hypothetical protein FACS1894125_5080 [Actinomycetota bacterium]
MVMDKTAKELLQMDEGKQLDFKRDLSGKSGIIKTIVAFANTAGGKILIGVKDKTKEIVGIEDPLAEEEKLANIIADTISPMIVPSVEYANVDNKTLIVVTVYPASQKAHFVKSAEPYEGTYVRIGSTNRQADRPLVAELNRQMMGQDFDEEVCYGSTIDDLDINYITEKFSEKLDRKPVDDKFLKTLKLVKPEQGKLVPTNAGMILFGKERTRFIPALWVQCARFKGKTKVDFIDNIDIDVPPLEAIVEIEKYIEKNALRGFSIVGLKRVDVWNVPKIALREILTNAFVHADYTSSGVNFKFAIYDDRMEFEVPGYLLPGTTVEEVLHGGLSKIRNHNIARVFNELGLIEKWGSGMTRIAEDLASFGLPPLEIREVAGRTIMTVYCDITKPRTVGDTNSDKSDLKEAQFGQKPLNSDRIDAKMSELSKNVRIAVPEVLEHLEYYPSIDSDRMAEIAGKTVRTAQRMLGELVAVGILKESGSTRNRVYLLK